MEWGGLVMELETNVHVVWVSHCPDTAVRMCLPWCWCFVLRREIVNSKQLLYSEVHNSHLLHYKTEPIATSTSTAAAHLQRWANYTK